MIDDCDRSAQYLLDNIVPNKNKTSEFLSKEEKINRNQNSIMGIYLNPLFVNLRGVLQKLSAKFRTYAQIVGRSGFLGPYFFQKK